MGRLITLPKGWISKAQQGVVGSIEVALHSCAAYIMYCIFIATSSKPLKSAMQG